MKWIGLTGGIATGKSTAADLLKSRGFAVIDADEISRELTKPQQEAYLKIVSHFGSEVLSANQNLDRARLAQIVFTNSQKKAELEQIIHPLIQKEVQKKRNELSQKGTSLCFYDVPLLFEKNMMSQFYKTLLIWCPYELQLERLMKRNLYSETEARLRISQQMNIIDKVKSADFCLDNSTSLTDLNEQIDHLLQKLI